MAFPSVGSVDRKKKSEAPRTTNTYGPDGTITTEMTREGIDIGEVPDFWKDFEEVQRRLPRAAPPQRSPLSAARQGAALQQLAPPTEGRRPAPAQPQYEDMYSTVIGHGPQSAGIAYQPWKPGMAFSPLNPPVFTGRRRIS